MENINVINMHKINPEMFIDKEHMMESWTVFSEYLLTQGTSDFDIQMKTKIDILKKYCIGWAYSKDMSNYPYICRYEYNAVLFLFGMNNEDGEYNEFWFHIMPSDMRFITNLYKDKIIFVNNDDIAVYW